MDKYNEKTQHREWQLNYIQHEWFSQFCAKEVKKDYILHKSIYAKLKKAETMALGVRIIILGISS